MIRDRVLEEVRAWVNTPYVHQAGIRGAGCDCVGLLVGVYGAADAQVKVDIPAYSPQWHLHQKGRELLLNELDKYCARVDDARPADVVAFVFGHAYSHTAIVVAWPLCVHASLASLRVEYVDAERDPHLSRCKRLIFRPNAIIEEDARVSL